MTYIGVIGGARCTSVEKKLAEEVGREIAGQKAVLICGGRGGVMEAAARGARRAGGLVIGILPGHDRREGNPYLSVSLATGLGDARNAIIACACDVLIAIGGGYGTLSEIGLALKMGKPVVGLHTWNLDRPGHGDDIHRAAGAREAVMLAVKLARLPIGNAP
ncbi:TIGR00725 family protein [Desulfofundulus thermobenzoicus]|uniref:TIGR00725 family protein n=2 Tax=Desulfofundulus thermobenzoicus TaxID=29376 RepID=A0A6N7IMX8_9FIRM|nr:TIGR00725 family protein [Desulfofundulus thermobenzoicus]